MAQRKWLNYTDYQKALEEVLQELPPIIIVEGEEEHLRHLALERIQQKILTRYPQAAEVLFHGPTVQGEGKFNFTDLLTELTSASLFSTEKIITFRSAQRSLFSAGTTDTSAQKIPPVQSLAEYIKNPTLGNFLLIEVEKINKQRIIGKAMAQATIIPCPVLNRQNDVTIWMRNEAKMRHKELDIAAAAILYQAYGSDLGILAGEIDKLVLYSGAETRITTEDAKQFLSGTTEFNIFELTNALEKRNLANSLKFVRLICQQGSRDQKGKKQDGITSAHQALALISSLLENLLTARALCAEELTPAELTHELGVHPRRAESISASARNFTLEELRYALNTLALEMKSTHDTGADPKLSLERIAIAICNKRPHYSS